MPTPDRVEREAAALLDEAFGPTSIVYRGERYPSSSVTGRYRAVACVHGGRADANARERVSYRGGDGFDVLDGHARALSATGDDWTQEVLCSARAMLALAEREAVHVGLLMDISAACGSQVIHRGARSRGCAPRLRADDRDGCP